MKQYHHGNLRPALVEAGLAALAEHGLEAMSLRDVARRAGVSPTAVYRHFADKDALLAAIAGEVADHMFRTVEEAIAKAPPGALSRFRATGIAYVQFAVAHPAHFRAMSTPGLLERLPPEHRSHAAKREQRADLERGMASGEIHPQPIDDLLLAANALVHGLAHMIVEGRLGHVTPARATQLAVEATGVLGCGLVPREATRTSPPPSATAASGRTRRR